MKKKRIYTLINMLLMLQVGLLQAQESTTASGNSSSGPGGNISYSAGLVAYSFQSGLPGSVSEGLMHPFEHMMATPTCVGDANSDGYVNILDLIAVSTNFGCTDNCSTGDSNFDGLVNILDLIATSSNFGTSCI